MNCLAMDCRPKKGPSFFEGVGVALAASFAGASGHAALVTVGAAGLAAQLVITILGLAYLGYLLIRSGRRIGRVTTMACAGFATLALGFLAPSLLAQLIAQVLLVWLVCTLYFHRSLLNAGADLVLCALSFAGATWAGLQTGSLFLSIWCLFLVQALHVLLPPPVATRHSLRGGKPIPKPGTVFPRATGG